MVSHLEFWRKIGEKHFHICKDCLNIPLSEEDLVMIGFDHGYKAHKEYIRKTLFEVRDA